MRTYRRSLAASLRRAAREFPVVVLTGPRQAGKTTLLRHTFGARYNYVSLEPPDVRALVATDPRGFLDAHPPPVIFDEVQWVPDLLAFIKERVDAKRDLPGQYLLTGSQNLLLMGSVSETLAGRTAVLRLLGMSRAEAHRQLDARLPWEAVSAKPKARRASPLSWTDLVRGSYPELVVHPKRDRALWHSSYLQTYIERDVRTLRNIGDLTQFQIFLRALAARSAQLFNMSALARDLGVAVNTIKAWLSVLEASHQIVIVRPYYANIGKRLVKTPKIYFTDTGTLCHLTGLRDPEHARQGPLAGAILETAVLGELLRRYWNRADVPQIYFWRTATGTEVDFVVEAYGRLIPVEVKLSSTVRPEMARGIEVFQKDHGSRADPGYVVYGGTRDVLIGHGTRALPFGVL